jgi:hypothetical protein
LEKRVIKRAESEEHGNKNMGGIWEKMCTDRSETLGFVFIYAYRDEFGECCAQTGMEFEGHLTVIQ